MKIARRRTIRSRMERWMLAICFFLLAFPLPVHADTGPKPSVNIDFEGQESGSFYVTLLSETAENGPWRAGMDYEEWYGDREIWDAFQEYISDSGYYFLGYFGECSGTELFQWTYYPPERFRILLYFPQTETFLESKEDFTRYAFDSYFTANLCQTDAAQGGGLSLEVRKSYDYGREIRGLIFRVLLTLVIELLVAWRYGFRSKKQFLLIFFANLVTQTALNAALNAILYYSGPHDYLLYYGAMELLVFLFEGFIYSAFLGKPQTKRDRTESTWIYALAANLHSLVWGSLLAHFLPGLF